MESHAHEKIDPIGYLVAPLVPPTLNILFVPALAALSGRPEQSAESAAWMAIAWFGLEAICLATIYPLLWLCRNFIMKLSMPTKYAIAASIALSGLASYMLFGGTSLAHAIPLSWIAATIASTFAFIAYQSRFLHKAKNALPQ